MSHLLSTGQVVSNQKCTLMMSMSKKPNFQSKTISQTFMKNRWLPSASDPHPRVTATTWTWPNNLWTKLTLPIKSPPDSQITKGATQLHSNVNSSKGKSNGKKTSFWNVIWIKGSLTRSKTVSSSGSAISDLRLTWHKSLMLSSKRMVSCKSPPVGTAGFTNGHSHGNGRSRRNCRVCKTDKRSQVYRNVVFSLSWIRGELLRRSMRHRASQLLKTHFLWLHRQPLQTLLNK